MHTHTHTRHLTSLFWLGLRMLSIFSCCAALCCLSCLSLSHHADCVCAVGACLRGRGLTTALCRQWLVASSPRRTLSDSARHANECKLPAQTDAFRVACLCVCAPSAPHLQSDIDAFVSHYGGQRDGCALRWFARVRTQLLQMGYNSNMMYVEFAEHARLYR